MANVGADISIDEMREQYTRALDRINFLVLELDATKQREQRALELYESALQVTQRLQAERESLLARVEAALLGIASVTKTT